MYLTDCNWSTAVVLLRKYYNILLDWFPDDHITTVALLNEIVPLKAEVFEEIIAYTDPKEANERMLNSIIRLVEHDEQFLRICELVKPLIGSKRDSDEFLEFEIGKYTFYMHICTYVNKALVYTCPVQNMSF